MTREVSPALYDRALHYFDHRQLVDLVVMMGYYVMTAGMRVAFDIQLDPWQEPTLPKP